MSNVTIWLSPFIVIRQEHPEKTSVVVGGVGAGHSTLAKPYEDLGWMILGGGRAAIDEVMKTIELSGDCERYGREPNRQETMKLLLGLYGDGYVVSERPREI